MGFFGLLRPSIRAICPYIPVAINEIAGIAQFLELPEKQPQPQGGNSQHGQDHILQPVQVNGAGVGALGGPGQERTLTTLK